jgi:hypothetical protein
MPVDLLADRKLESGPARVGESPSESIRSENALVEMTPPIAPTIAPMAATSPAVRFPANGNGKLSRFGDEKIIISPTRTPESSTYLSAFLQTPEAGSKTGSEICAVMLLDINFLLCGKP